MLIDISNILVYKETNMKKTILLLLISLLFVSLSGCALFELIEGNKHVVDLGNGEEFVKWNLVSNNNDYQNVDSAYFEFNDDVFKYYENGSLKREGKHRITFFWTREYNKSTSYKSNI